MPGLPDSSASKPYLPEDFLFSRNARFTSLILDIAFRHFPLNQTTLPRSTLWHLSFPLFQLLAHPFTGSPFSRNSFSTLMASTSCAETRFCRFHMLTIRRRP